VARIAAALLKRRPWWTMVSGFRKNMDLIDVEWRRAKRLSLLRR
jgi:hypothetical protein